MVVVVVAATLRSRRTWAPMHPAATAIASMMKIEKWF